LLNILPKEIAAILKNEERTIADHFSGASILFADMVGFTPLTAAMAPAETVELLNEVFTSFDALVDKYGLEEIRTIGDSYMSPQACRGRAMTTPRRWRAWHWRCAAISRAPVLYQSSAQLPNWHKLGPSRGGRHRPQKVHL
jgi:class 3 adenylate cyclase